MINNKELKEKTQTLAEAQRSFYYFTENIFSKSFDNFVGGAYVEESCNQLIKHDRTMRIAFRSGFKSTSFYSFIEYLIMFRGISQDLDIRYFSYNETMGAFHVRQLKTLIKRNPYFNELIDLKPTAENVAAYTWNRRNIIRITPVGVVSFTRGLKADIILLDDILSDPTNPIHPTVILKIGEIFKSVILESLRPGGEIHIIRSPLSLSDIYFEPAVQKEFHFRSHPAIIKDANGNEVPAWPEFYTLEKLKAKVKIMGEKVFQAEMMMVPYYSADSFFKKEQLRKNVVNSQLRNLRIIEGIDTPNLVVAGFDIGKKKHSSSFDVFMIENGKAIQIHHKTMKGWKYYNGKTFDPLEPTQLEYCKEGIKNFGIDYIYYDNTRGEFEGASDMGILTPHFVPIVFTPKMKVQMATDLEKIVLNKQIEMLDDEEILNSMCSITNDLQKVEISGDHADTFDSFCLAMIGFSKFGHSDKKDKEVRTGCKSIFAKGGKVPKGW